MKSLKDNILKDFTKYVSLNVISMIGLSFYILADTFFIANGVGSIGLTALNLVFSKITRHKIIIKWLKSCLPNIS